jgi:hypothetical protein
MVLPSAFEPTDRASQVSFMPLDPSTETPR